MKRLIAMLTTALVVGGAVPAGAGPSAGGGVEQGALAAWIQMKGDKGTIKMAMGSNFVANGEAHIIGGVAKGTCKRGRAAGWVITSCTARGRMKEVGIEGFQMDPLLQGASLKVKQAGQMHRVDWTGSDQTAGQGAYAGGWGAYAGAGADAWAKATGRVYGAKVKKGCWFCLLYEGAGAGVFTGLRHRAEVSTEDGVLQVKLQTWKRI